MHHQKRQYWRISDSIDGVILLMQALLVARFLVDLLGFKQSGQAALLELLTAPFVGPWHLLISPFSVGKYVFDLGTALSLTALPLLGWLLSLGIDAYRIRHRERLQQYADQPS